MAMQIVGGSFGVSGSAKINEHGLMVDGVKPVLIRKHEIQAVNTSRNQSREFGVLAFLFWGVLFGLLGWWLLGALGAVVGVIAAVALSFSKKTVIRASVSMTEGRSLELEGWHYEIQKLAKLAIDK